MSDTELTLRKCDHVSDDWWVIEEEGGGDFSDASVEGTGAEMLAIAAAIESRGQDHFKRCEVFVDERAKEARFCSPRNTQGHRGTCSLAAADRLAKLIRELVPQGTT